MLWLVLISFALVAVWGTSDRWDLSGARRRVVESVSLRPGGHGHHGADDRHEGDDPHRRA